MADKRTYVNPATTLLEASNRSRAHLGNISANSGDALQALKDLAYETALNAGPVLAGNQLLGAAERNLGPGGALEVIPGQAWSTIPGTEIGGAIGSAVDTVAGPVLSLASSLARVGIGAVELQNIAPWLMDTARLDVNDIENLAVFQSPRATPEQKAKAWQYMTTKEIPQLIGGPITLDEYYSKASGRADTASTLLNLKQDITDNLDSDYPVRREVRGALDRDAKFHEASQNIQDTVDAKGALSLEYLGAILANSPQLAMSGLGAAADHPLSAVHNVAENSGASLLAAYFGGPAAMAAVSSLQEAPGFLGERLVKGHIAPRKHGVSGVEQTVGLVGTAAAHAAADFAGDLLMAKIGGLLKGAKGTASSPLAALGEASAAKGLGVIPATLKAGIKTVGSIGVEMGTEGIQHDLEQYIRNEPTSATARGEAMALASISAGAISTPGSVLGIARDVALRRGNNQVEGSAFNSHELRALEKARKEAIPNEEALVKAGLMRPLGMQLLIERTHYLDGQIKKLGKTANDASATPEERTKAHQALTRVKAELTQHLDLMDGMAAPRIAAGNAAIDTLIAVRDPLAITDPDGNATTYGDMKTRVHAMATDGTSKDVRKRWEDALETKAEELRSVPGVAEAEDAYMKHLADPVLSTIPEFLDSRKKAQVTNTKKAAAKQQMQAKNAAAKAKAATRKMAAKAAKAAKKAAATASPSQGTTAPTSPAIPASGGLVAPGGTTTPIQGQAATSTQGATTPSTPMVTQGPVTPQSAAAAIMGTAASVDPGAIDDTADTDDADTDIAPDEQDLTADAKDLEEIIIRNMASLDELVQTAEFQEFYERVKDYLSPGIGALLRESMNLATTTKYRATTLEGTRAQKLTSGGVHARSALHYLKEMLDYLETGVGAKRARNSVVAQRRYADNQAERAQAIKEAHARAKARGYTANEGLLFVVKDGIMEVIQVPVEDGEAGRDAAKAANPDILVIHSGSTRLVAAALEEADSLAAIARALEAVVDTDIKDAAAVAKAKQRLLQGFLEANLEEDMKPLTAINNTSGAPMSLHAARKLLKGKIAEYASALHLLAASEYQDGPAFMLGLLNLVVNTQDTRVISTVLAKNPALNTRVDRRRKSPLFRVRSGVAMLYAWAEINQNSNASLNEAGLTALLMAWDQRYGRSLTGNLASEYLQEAPASPITQSSRASRGNAQATPVAGRNAVSGAPVDTQAPQTVIGAPVTQPVAPATPVAPVKPAPVVAAAPAAPAAPAAEAAPATPAATPAATTPPAAPVGKDAGAVAPTKKPVDQITADDWSAIIGYIEGPARPDGSNENIDTDTFLLLKKMVIKIIKDGVKNGTPRERIIQQIEGVTKGGVSNKAMSNIHSLLDAQTVNASAPAAPAAPAVTTKPAPAATTRTPAPGRATTPAPAENSRTTQDGVTIVELKASDYPTRTKHNASTSDVTIAFAADFSTAGEKQTKTAAAGKYITAPLSESLKDDGAAIDMPETWYASSFMKLVNGAPATINIAGNTLAKLMKALPNKKDESRADKAVRAQQLANRIVYQALKALHEKSPITKIVSGGQTGADIAGAVAAKALGIPVEVVMPKGFLQQDLNGNKTTQVSAQAIIKQIEDGAAALLASVGGSPAPVATPAVDSEVTADDFMGDEAAPVTADFEGDAAQSDELIGGVDDSQDTPGVSAEDFWGKDDAGYLDSLGEAVTAPATEAKVSAPAPVKPAAPSNVAVNRDNTAEDPRLSSTETAYQRAQRKAVEEGAPVRTRKDYLKDVTDHILNRLKGPMRVKVKELAKHMAFLQIAKEQNATPYVLLPELQEGVYIPAESSSNAYDIAAEGTEGMQGNARQLGAFGSAMKDLQEGKSVVVYVSFPGASRFSKKVRPDGVIPRDAYTTAVMYFVENIQNMIQVARENGASLTIIADDAISAFTPHNSDTEGVFYKALEGMPGEVLGIPIVPDLTNPWMLRAINAALRKRKDANGEVASIVGVIAALKATNALLPGESAGMVWQVVPKNLPTADKLGKATELTATLEAHGFQKYFTMPRLAINRMKELWGNATHTFAGNWNTLQQVLLPAIPTLSGTTDTGSVLASMDTATMEDVQMLRRATALIRSEVEKWDPYIAHRTGNSDPAVAALRAFFDAEGKFVPVVQEAISYAILNMMLRNKHGNPYNKDDQIEKLVDSLFPDNIGISEAAYVALTSPGIIHSNLVNTLGTDIVKHLQLNSLDTTYSGLLDTTVAYLGGMVVHALVQDPSTKKTYVGPFRAKELVLGESLGSANTADTGELEYQEIPAGFITVSQFDNPQDSHGAGDIINKRVLQYVDLGDIRTDAFALAAYHLEYVSNGVAQALTGYSDNQTLPSSKPVSPYKGTINESFGLVQKISDVVRKALSGMNAAPRYVETETIELLDTLMEAWGITDTDILKNGANPSTDPKVQAAMAGFLTLLNGDGMQDSQRIPFLRKRKWSKELQFFKHFMEVRNWGNRRSNPDEAVFLSHNSWSMERSAVDTLVGNPTSPINRVLLRPGSLEANKLGAEWQKLDQEVQQIIKANKAKDPEYVFKYKDAKIQLNRIKAIRARLNSLSAPTAYDLSSPGYALSADMHALYIGFAAGLGISIDKDAHAASLQELLDRAGWYISTGILEKQSSIPDTAERRAITVLKAYLASRDTSNTPEAVTDVDTPVAETPKAVFDEDALSSLKEAVLSGGLGLETLATLLNMARLERAVEQSAGEVSIYQANAVDGVSNGPSLAQLLVGSLSRITKENFLSVLRAADRHAPSEFNADAPVSVRIRELIKANDRGMASAQDIKLLNDLSALFTRELSDLQKWRDRAGFFKDSPVDVPLADFKGDFNVFRGQQGVQDTYEAVGATLVQGVVKALGLNKEGAPNAPLYSALDTLWGINESTSEASKSKTRTKKYRGLLKNPITQVVYGAGYRAIAVSIGSTLFYEVLEAIQTEEAAIQNATDANIKAQHAARLLELQKVFFTFSPIQNKPHPSDKEIGYTWAELRNSVNGHGMYAYMPAFIDKAGAAIASPVWFVMTTAFNNLIENRRPIQVVNQAGFRGARDSYLYTRTQLLNKQAITEVDGQKVVVNDLTVKQEKILRKLLNHLLPRVGTPAGKFDETSNDGMLISGKRTKVEVSNETVDAGLNSQLTAAMGNWHKIGMPGRIQAIKGRVAVLAAPGVQVLPLPILATDASISHGSLLREDPKTGTTYVAPFFNNHDSHAGDARDIAAQTRELNKNTLHALINYEPMLATLEGALVGLERAFGVIPEDVISQEDLDTLGVTREELAQFARNGFLQSLIDSLFVPNDDAMSATAKSNTVDENQVSINARTTPYNARARIGEIFRDAQGILKGFNAWLTKEGSAPELAALLGESSIDGILQGTLTDALSEKQKGERALILLTAAILRLRMRGIGAMSAKFGEIKEFTYISQYAFEGGAYKVTDADRQEALAALDAQQKKNASMDERLASVMNAMAKALAVYTPVEPVKAIEAASAKDVAPAADTLINLEPEGVPSDSESQNVSVSSATPVSGNERLEAAQVGLKDTEVALTTATEAMVSRAPGLANFYKGLQAFIKAMLTDSNRVQVYALPFSEITTDMLDALGIPPKGHRKIMNSTSNAIVLPSHNIILINAKPGEWAGTTLLHEMLHLVWRRFLLSKPAKAARASDNGFEASMAILRDAVDTLMAMTAEDIKASGLSSTEQTLLKGIQKLLKKHLDSVSKKLTDEGLDEGVVYLLSTPGLLNAVTPHIGKADTGQATAANLQILKGSRTVTTALNALKNVYTAFKDYLARFTKTPPTIVDAVPLAYSYLLGLSMNTALPSLVSENTDVALRNMVDMSDNSYGGMLESQMLADGLDPAFANRVGKTLQQTQEQLFHLQPDTLQARVAFEEALSGQDQNSWNTFIPDGAAEALIGASTLSVAQSELIAINQFESLYRQLLAATTGVGYQFRRQMEAIHQEAVTRYPTAQAMLAVIPNPTQADVDQVNEMHALLFDHGLDGANALARFASLTVGYMDIGYFFEYKAKKPGNPKGTITQRLVHWISQLLTWFESKEGVRTRSGSAQEQLRRALLELMANQIRFKKWQTKRANRKVPRFNKLVTAMSGWTGKALESDWVMKNKFPPVRLVGALYETARDGGFQDYMDKLRELRDMRHPKDPHGFMMRLATEMRGVSNKMLPVFGLFNNMRIMENHRQDTIRDVATASLSAFKAGTSLKKKERSLILDMGLRTGLWRIGEHFNKPSASEVLQEYLQDPAALARDRQAVLASLRSMGATATQLKWYDWHSDHLGYFWATGESYSNYMLGNLEAVLIRGRVEETDTYTPAMIEAVGTLTALYAVEHQIAGLTQQARQVLERLVDTEVSRTDTGDGFQFISRMQKDFDNRTENLYVDDDGDFFWGSMQDNWLPSLTDPDSPMVELSKNLPMHKALYRGVPGLTGTDGKTGLAIGKHNKVADVRSGALVYGRTHIEGARMGIHYGAGQQLAYPNKKVGNSGVNSVLPWLNQVMATAPAAARKGGKRGNLVFLAKPNTTGNEEHYLQLSHREKRVYQGAVEDFSDVLGAYAGKLFEKEDMLATQLETVKALLKFQEQEPLYKAWVKAGSPPMGPTYKALAASWDLVTSNHFPQKVQEAMGASMWVRRDMVPVVAGERKFSLAERVFNDAKHPDQNALLRAVGDQIVNFLATFKGMPPKVAREFAWQWVHNAGRITKAMVSEIKDRIVVTSVTVFVGNTLSNLYHLVNTGVPFKTILRGYILGHQAATQYRRDFAEVEQLRYQVAVGVSDKPLAETQRKLAVVQARLQNNPVGRYIQAGLLPSIVEDIAVTEAGHFDLRNKARDKVRGYIPTKIRGVANEVFMQPGSQVYQGLNTLTQLSDFSARVALMEHWKETKDARPFNDQVLWAMNEFVWYDLPSDTRLEWANEVGLVMFSKYFLRVQKVLAELILRHPVRTLTMGLFDSLILDIPDAMESLMGVSEMPWDVLGSSVFNADEILTGGAIVDTLL